MAEGGQGLQRGSQKETQTETEENKRKRCTCKPFELNVLYLNVRSINPNNVGKNNVSTVYGKKIKEIKQLIAENNPDIIAFVETWLNENKGHDNQDIKSMLNLEGYQIYRQDRHMDTDSAYNIGGLLSDYPYDLSDFQERRGGGIMVAVNSTALLSSGITFDKYCDEDLLDAVSNYQIKYELACNKCDQSKQAPKKFLFSIIYRRPDKFRNESQDSYDKLNKDIVDRMTHLSSFFSDSLIGFNGMVMVGDFNLTTSSPEFRYVAMENFFTNFEKTHRGGRAIDHIIYYPGDLVTNRLVTNPISDHSALLFDLQLGIGTEPLQTCKKCTN